MIPRYRCNECGFEWDGKPGPQVAFWEMKDGRMMPKQACPICPSLYCTWLNYKEGVIWKQT